MRLPILGGGRMKHPIGASIVGVQGPCDAAIVTYDDGPRPGDTDAILHELAA